MWGAFSVNPLKGRTGAYCFDISIRRSVPLLLVSASRQSGP